MNKLITRGIICLKDDYNFLYKIADIDYIEYENEEFSYYFYPYYPVIDLLGVHLFQGIHGLNLSKRKEVYERHNMTPVFISERTPSKNRVDLYELLEKYNMKSLNRLRWLINTDMQYFGDNLFAIENNEENQRKLIEKDSMFDLVKRSDNLNHALLNIICSGDYLKCKEIEINDDNRKYYYDLLMPIYIKEYTLRLNRIKKGIENTKKLNGYKGRKKIKLDTFKFNDVVKDYKNGSISMKEAIDALNISKSTFIRRLKEIKE